MLKQLFLLTATLALTTSLNAQISQELASRNNPDNASWNLGIDYESMHGAKVYKPKKKKETKLDLQTTVALLTKTIETSEKDGFLVGIGYQDLRFDFSKAKPFTQKQFDSTLFNFGYYTQADPNWLWKANLIAQVSNDDFSLSRYTFFTGLLHGTYGYTDEIHLHAGVLAYAGMRYSRALPVLGFEYMPKDTPWKVKFVYPLEMYYTYNLSENWSWDLGIRYFLTRQRLQDDYNPDRGFVAFRTWGAEVGLNYTINNILTLNAHIGETLANRMRVSNHDDKNRHHYRMRPAPYYGVVLSLQY